MTNTGFNSLVIQFEQFWAKLRAQKKGPASFTWVTTFELSANGIFRLNTFVLCIFCDHFSKGNLLNKTDYWGFYLTLRMCNKLDLGITSYIWQFSCDIKTSEKDMRLCFCSEKWTLCWDVYSVLHDRDSIAKY